MWEAAEAALALLAAFAVGIAPLFGVVLIFVISVIIREWDVTLITGAILAFAGPPSFWVYCRAQEQLPLRRTFCVEISDRVSELSLFLRCQFGVVWFGQMLACLAYGVACHA